VRAPVVASDNPPLASRLVTAGRPPYHRVVDYRVASEPFSGGSGSYVWHHVGTSNVKSREVQRSRQRKLIDHQQV
jgi:hypothetical protein